MWHSCLQPPSHKWLDPWNVKWSLSLSESWALASSYTNFKLAWKMSIILAPVITKFCSYLTLLHTENQQFFFSIMQLFLFLILGDKIDQLGHLPPEICFDSHSNVNFCPIFYLKGYLHHTKPFRKTSDGPYVSSPFLGDNMPGCAKMISSWGRKILVIAKAYMFLATD